MKIKENEDYVDIQISRTVYKRVYRINSELEEYGEFDDFDRAIENMLEHLEFLNEELSKYSQKNKRKN